jgi:hypothetical protein
VASILQVDIQTELRKQCQLIPTSTHQPFELSSMTSNMFDQVISTNMFNTVISQSDLNQVFRPPPAARPPRARRPQPARPLT